ncbi:MAG: hypothetical protein H0S79_18005 [Anaerolineaceae bacterium]|nr:hypothetical protein [Anaerolineaceae bacterium]
MDNTIHRQMAIDLFNLTWDLMEKTDRTQAETDRMINAAHASRYHWEIAGEAVNIARGEWQISRVYAVVGRSEPCLYHAERCLQVTLENDLVDFDLAFAYEAMARAWHLVGDLMETAKFITLGQEAGEKISGEEDRVYFFKELNTIEAETD